MCRQDAERVDYRYEVEVRGWKIRLDCGKSIYRECLIKSIVLPLVKRGREYFRIPSHGASSHIIQDLFAYH